MKGSGFGLSPFYLGGTPTLRCVALSWRHQPFLGGVIIVRHTVFLFIFGQDLFCMAGE
ncbi:hypothetical protein HDF11_003188 [Tunturiibacter psychrotolerans]